MSTTVRIRGDEALVRKLSSRVADPPVRRFLTRGAVVIQGNMRRRVRVDTGRGRNSIAYEVAHRRARVGTDLAYLEVMARGRKPGRRPPPPGALVGWMRRHGMDPSKEFLLARAIGRRGIKGDDFDTKAVADSRPQIARLLPVLAHDLDAAWRAA